MNFKLSLVSVLALSVVIACGKSEDPTVDQAGSVATVDDDVATPATGSGAVVEIIPGLTMRILREGSGAVAESGDIAIVHYTGWLYDAQAVNNRGKMFDSSVERGEHFQFPLGAGRVIRGWDEGVAGMREGELRELTIAPELAYGDRNVGGGLIPAGSTLVFEVELARAQSVQPDVTLPTAPQ
jgi:FKBP-type peptidyl-prolyl cis-trans isomerase FkpA